MLQHVLKLGVSTAEQFRADTPNYHLVSSAVEVSTAYIGTPHHPCNGLWCLSRMQGASGLGISTFQVSTSTSTLYHDTPLRWQFNACAYRRKSLLTLSVSLSTTANFSSRCQSRRGQKDGPTTTTTVSSENTNIRRAVHPTVFTYNSLSPKTQPKSSIGVDSTPIPPHDPDASHTQRQRGVYDQQKIENSSVLRLCLLSLSAAIEEDLGLVQAEKLHGMSTAAARSGGGASSATVNQRAADFRRQVRARIGCAHERSALFALGEVWCVRMCAALSNARRLRGRISATANRCFVQLAIH